MYDCVALFLELLFLVCNILKIIFPYVSVHNQILAAKIQRLVLLRFKRNAHVITGNICLRLLEITLIMNRMRNYLAAVRDYFGCGRRADNVDVVERLVAEVPVLFDLLFLLYFVEGYAAFKQEVWRAQ